MKKKKLLSILTLATSFAAIASFNSINKVMASKNIPSAFLPVPKSDWTIITEGSPKHPFAEPNIQQTNRQNSPIMQDPEFVARQEGAVVETHINEHENMSTKDAKPKPPKTPKSIQEEYPKRKYTDNKKLLKDLLGKQENENIEIECKHCERNFKLSEAGRISKHGNNTFTITCPHPDCQRQPSYELDTQAKKLKCTKIKHQKHQKHKKRNATPEEKANYISEIGKTHPCGRCRSQNVSNNGKQRLICNLCKYERYMDAFSIPVPACPKGHSNENVTGIQGSRAEGKLNWRCETCNKKWSTYNVQTPAAKMHDNESDSSSSSEDSE